MSTRGTKPRAPSAKSKAPSARGGRTVKAEKNQLLPPGEKSPVNIPPVPSPISEFDIDQALATLKDCISEQYGEAELVKRFFERIWVDVTGIPPEEETQIRPNFVDWLSSINVPLEVQKHLVKIIDPRGAGKITRVQFVEFGGSKMSNYFGGGAGNSARSAPATGGRSARQTSVGSLPEDQMYPNEHVQGQHVFRAAVAPCVAHIF